MGLSREKGYPDKRPYRNALEKSARCQRALALGEMLDHGEAERKAARIVLGRRLSLTWPAS